MAKLYLKFEQTVLKEVPLAQGITTIGRLPDNLLQIDNLAVSGHHAKIYWDQDHYVIEDLGSLNGTYVNNQRVGKASLKDGDSVIIGKHLVQFKEEGQKAPSEKPASATRLRSSGYRTRTDSIAWSMNSTSGPKPPVITSQVVSRDSGASTATPRASADSRRMRIDCSASPPAPWSMTTSGMGPGAPRGR